MANQYTPKDIETFNRKDQRISWLSIFSSLCIFFKADGNNPGILDEGGIKEITNKINDALYQRYPFVENNEEEKPL